MGEGSGAADGERWYCGGAGADMADGDASEERLLELWKAEEVDEEERSDG